MNSIKWPNMFNENNSSISLVSDKDAIKQSISLLLNTDRLSFFGDPYYGTLLKKSFFEPNTVVILDLLIDEIYTVIKTYIPQITLYRNNITINSYKDKIIADIHIIYNIDNTSDLYSIELTDTIQEG